MTQLFYDLPLYRPPSEAENLIIQATLGCSFNRCTFCAMYKTREFRARDIAEVFDDIDRAAEVSRETRRVFLADGDALVLPTDQLVAILNRLAETFPELQRVTTYALPANLLKKSVEELRLLREHKLTLVYYGIETGSADILRRIRKGATPQGMIEGLRKAREAGIKTSCTVILGVGGKKHWRDHIESTANLVNAAAPNYVSTLQLMLDETTLDDFLTSFGEAFEFQDDDGILAEQELFVSLIEPNSPVIFRSNHASNALPLAGTFPKDKARLLAEIRAARDGTLSLRPAWARAL
ncbi:MAG TPA: radical SAM protein [Alphaproteobacteria bacterium]|jgi:coproporphyrinogen III oxidase-like Fe-S oxidoreductase|nr:radical SAM protein [Alphaproteobacteria bacterium]